MTEKTETAPNYVQVVLDRLDATSPGLPPELLDLYTLLVLVVGEEVTLRDVHDAWAVWRNRTRPDHPSLIPFGHLSRATQELDTPYALAIAETYRAGVRLSDGEDTE